MVQSIIIETDISNAAYLSGLHTMPEVTCSLPSVMRHLVKPVIVDLTLRNTGEREVNFSPGLSVALNVLAHVERFAYGIESLNHWFFLFRVATTETG